MIKGTPLIIFREDILWRFVELSNNSGILSEILVQHFLPIICTSYWTWNPKSILENLEIKKMERNDKRDGIPIIEFWLELY